MAKPAKRAPQQVSAAVAAQDPSWLDRDLNPFVAFSAALVLSLCVFYPALRGDLVFDDYYLAFARDGAANQGWNYWINAVRPVLMATYWANFLMAGAKPFIYHLTGVLFHAINGALVYYCLSRVLAIAGVKSNRNAIALFASAVFLVHPLQTEVVDYISGRSDAVASLFVLAAWAVFLRKFDEAPGAGTISVIALLGALGLLAKESAIAAPAVLLATDIFFPVASIGAQLRRKAWLYGIFLGGGILAAFAILRNLSRTSLSAGFGGGLSPVPYALTQCKVILIYARLFFVPLGQNADWRLPFIMSLTDGLAVVWVALLLGLVALTFWLYRRNRLASFGLAFFLLTLAPTSSIVPVADAMAERRVYLSIIGLVLMIVAFALALPRTGLLRVAAFTAIAFCAVLTFARSTVWASDVALWSDSIRNNPLNPRAHVGLAAALMRKSECGAAAGEFAAARDLGQTDSSIFWDIASALQCAKRPEPAEQAYRQYLAHGGQVTSEYHANLGFVEAQLGKESEAMADFDRAVQLDPNNPQALAYRGIARSALGDSTGAGADFRAALRIDPKNAFAANGLANLQAPR